MLLALAGLLQRCLSGASAGAPRGALAVPLAALLDGECMEENVQAGPGPGEQSGSGNSSPPAKRRRVQLAGAEGAGEKRYVPPPKKRNPGVSFSEAHFAETSYYFEGGLRKVRPYYFDFQTYCKGRWVGKSLLHVFGTEFRSQTLEYYRAAASAGRLRLNEQPVRDLHVVLKASEGTRQLVLLRLLLHY